MRFANLAELLKRKSPDVVIMEEDADANLRHAGSGGFAPVKLPGRDRRTILEDRFLAHWQSLGGCQLQREYRFDEKRMWRFDFAIPILMVAIEVQGGLYAPQSGHRSKEGVEKDYEKLNAAQQQGWKVFQITATNLDDAAYLQKLIDFVNSLG